MSENGNDGNNEEVFVETKEESGKEVEVKELDKYLIEKKETKDQRTREENLKILLVQQ